MKLCAKCGKPGEFYKDRSTKDGLTRRCKACQLTHAKSDPEHRRAKQKAWAAAHPEKVLGFYQKYESANRVKRRTRRVSKELDAAMTRRWRRANPARCAVLLHRRRARLAEVVHTLTHDEWLETLEVFDHRCAYCNQKSLRLTMEHVIAISRGGGHTKENVVPACQKHNSQKKDKPVFMMAQAA
jgi:5-methylcytosine-specific restriction endonuclease McrA